MFKIDEEPVERNIGYGSITGFLKSLDIGQSFVCPKSEAAKACVIGNQAGLKMSRKKISADEYRIWRIG